VKPGTKFLDSERLKVYPRIFIILYILIGAYWFLPGLLTQGIHLDPLGKPIGSDFVCFWTASQLALSSQSANLYSPDKFYAAEQNVAKVFYPLPWQYPPTFLLMVLPLAFMPYLLSLLVFLVVTGAGYIYVLWRIAPHRFTPWLSLAFPATFQNIIHGQNGFLTASLLGGGLALVRSHPVLAGISLGLLSYKPHIAAVIPVALVVGRHWKTLFSMIATGVVCIAISTAAFGYGLWLRFFQNISFASKLLIDGSHNLFKMPTVFGGTLLAGGSNALASSLQLLAGIAALICVVWIWSRRQIPLFLKSSALVVAILLITPYAFEYDLTILALPLAWLCWNFSEESGLSSVEEVVVLLAWLAPLVAAPVAKLTSIQVAPMMFVGLLLLITRKARTIRKQISPT
jgi:hypothetical protein